MIGIIVTGHGNFASGLVSSLKLITGSTEYIEIVDFLPEDSTDELSKKIQNALKNLSKCKGILILTDLLGGSPFKTSVVCSQNIENCKVIYGTNLPLLLEASIQRNSLNDVLTLVENVTTSTKEQIGYFQVKEPTINDEDGI